MEVSIWRCPRSRRRGTIGAAGCRRPGGEGNAVRHTDRPADPKPLVRALADLDDEYAAVLALLDQPAATHRLVVKVPDVAGVDMGWVGESVAADRLVLHYVVN